MDLSERVMMSLWQVLGGEEVRPTKFNMENARRFYLIKAFMGPLRAGFWQVFAWGFGASLKKEYDAKGVDRLTERVVLMVEAGQI